MSCLFFVFVTINWLLKKKRLQQFFYLLQFTTFTRFVMFEKFYESDSFLQLQALHKHLLPDYKNHILGVFPEMNCAQKCMKIDSLSAINCKGFTTGEIFSLLKFSNFRIFQRKKYWGIEKIEN